MLIDLKDRFARGLVAGLIATVILAALNLFNFHVLELTDHRYYNFASVLIFGRKADALGELVVSQLAQLGFGTAMGIVFAYFIIGAESRNYLLKGLLWGPTIELSSFAFANTIPLEPLLPITLQTVISMAITSSIWGIILARGLYILDKRYDTEKREEKAEKLNQQVIVKRKILSPAPAMKPHTFNRDFKLLAPVSINDHLSNKTKKGTKKGFKKPQKI
ncbi:MAG: hypothetical protein KGZ96_14725 [Clostridia bacterium]|nr:hypothetical protein [Clostridia bacterium]